MPLQRGVKTWLCSNFMRQLPTLLYPTIITLAMKKLLLLSLIFVGACASSPLGRKQLITVSDEQMNQMGQQGFEEMKQKIPRSHDQKIINYVNCVVEPLTKVVGGTWEVVVFQEKSANAFALPGGKVGVHTGILNVAKNDAQLGAVIGHEIGHVIAKHGAERVSQMLALEVGINLGDVLMRKGEVGQNKRKAILVAAGVAGQFGALAWSRTQESEADVVGLDLMSQAGFDPNQSIELWKNMAAQGGGKPPEWLSTHPSDETRINNLKSEIPKYLPKYQKAQSQGRNPHCQL
jgi:predicted Zn-dependent protease